MTDQPCAGCGFWGMPQTRGFKPGMGHNRGVHGALARRRLPLATRAGEPASNSHKFEVAKRPSDALVRSLTHL